ncbi:MAG TPA: N-acetylneuraminate synthase family protein [Candidatus Tectomicrobia bacterium]
MATLRAVNQAVRVSRNTGNEQPVLLHGVSDYPAAPVDANLRAMPTRDRGGPGAGWAGATFRRGRGQHAR